VTVLLYVNGHVPIVILLFTTVGQSKVLVPATLRSPPIFTSLSTVRLFIPVTLSDQSTIIPVSDIVSAFVPIDLTSLCPTVVGAVSYSIHEEGNGGNWDNGTLPVASRVATPFGCHFCDSGMYGHSW